MAETEEQQAVLAQIEKEAASLQLYKTQVKTTRNRLWELMTTARELRTSSYSIAEAAGISQPRVSQVIKEVREKENRDADESVDSPESPLGTLVDFSDTAGDRDTGADQSGSAGPAGEPD